MNKVILMGRLTRDPELRYTTNNNTAVCNFTLAVDRRFQRQGEERQADFIPIVVWSKLAEFCDRYFRKGRQVAVVGRIQVSNWNDNEGKRRYKTEVVADEAYFADSKPSGGSDTGNTADEDADSRTDSAGDSGEGKEEGDGFFPLDEEEDELPF